MTSEADAEAPRRDDPEVKVGPTTHLTRTAVMVLGFLALQNCAKNIVMRAAVRGKVDFLYSAAVIATEGLKCVAAGLWVVLIDGGSLRSIYRYLRVEWRKTLLLTVPAAIYNLQKTLEYVALRNLNAAVFSVLVQTKLFATAVCAVGLMGKTLRKAQVISLLLLTVGCILAQLEKAGCDEDGAAKEEKGSVQGNKVVGVVATLMIAFSSGFASVYTEKVIKAADKATESTKVSDKELPSLALPLVGGGGGGGGASSSGGTSSSSNGGLAMMPSSSSSHHHHHHHSAMTTTTAAADLSHHQKPQGLAYTQIQLAVASVAIEGAWAAATDYEKIQEHGLWYGFEWRAWLAVFMAALGGLAVAAVLKYADAILKGYATAISVVLTGLASHFLFGTVLHVEYALGMLNVLAAMVLYNSTNLNARAF
eukprot:CAMPEP_0118906580 /NCGR_PEP_ID=MMETSP1166-20130328/10290_1 /TAXON_ID=1104430 /ORGANISM="Chrysoreinhardia sp, Strain CCMP3193" /LENGTH=421 /DNA_ID=CAMNT_0006845903 /DNA_START=38 /DNA_END=1303 /DNA_ORIENTATION=-